eukprot:TRINITY_DN4139_c0_g1_i4.p2 TRINITY_DN4139_c0_g1~~TRINITY_DN4139_c0_g1_i4.p2  ORF type:complete len:245 (+),score=59.69 TRINITY_DN4139_c0_g1_i4:44-736(+)
MNEKAVEQQLKIMVSFIQQEAEEKKKEIEQKAEEEFYIEKARIVQAQKQKYAQEFERKTKQVEVNKKIAHSNELTKSRLLILQALEANVKAIYQKAKDDLNSISKKPEYKKLLVDLIIQGINKLREHTVEVQCRTEDVALTKEAIKDAIVEYEKHTGVKPTINLSEKHHLPPAPENAGPKALTTCAGGVVLSALNGRIICNNTLDVRLQYAYEAAVPEIRNKLFKNIKVV